MASNYSPATAHHSVTPAHGIHVLLADDHPLLLSGFARSLADYGIEVVGQTRSADAAVEQYGELKPDVVVLDIRFGDKHTGFDAARAILDEHPDARIVFLSQFDEDTLIKQAYRLGARAFVTKECDPEVLATAIGRAHAGEQFFLPSVAERLAQMAIRGDKSPQSILDARELTVFKLMAQGQTNEEIAVALSLSSKTISNTSKTIKDKLDVTRQADITILAVRHGLIEA